VNKFKPALKSPQIYGIAAMVRCKNADCVSAKFDYLKLQIKQQARRDADSVRGRV
jgi:aspartate carbamoyltransferase regulatory subunit